MKTLLLTKSSLFMTFFAQGNLKESKILISEYVNRIIKFFLVLFFLSILSPLFSQTQGDLRSARNVHISIVKFKGFGIHSEYFLGSKISLGLGLETVKINKNEASLGISSTNAFYYSEEVRDFRRNNFFFKANFYPFDFLGLYFIGKAGYTTGSSIEVKNRLLLGWNGEISPAFPFQQYGYRIEESGRGYLGAGLGYKHIISSGVFFGGELDLNFYPPQKVTEKYTIYPDYATLFPGARLDPIEYLFQRQIALNGNQQPRGFGQIRLFFGIAF